MNPTHVIHAVYNNRMESHLSINPTNVQKYYWGLVLCVGDTALFRSAGMKKIWIQSWYMSLKMYPGEIFAKAAVTWPPAVSVHLCNSVLIWKVLGNPGQMSVILLSNDSQLSGTKVQTMNQPLCDLTGDFKPDLTTRVKLQLICSLFEWLEEYWSWSCCHTLMVFRNMLYQDWYITRGVEARGFRFLI